MTFELEQIETIKRVIARFEPLLSPNDAGFLKRLFSKGMAVYKDRIIQYGLQNCTSVLDAGCGFGQWSIALSQENLSVTAIDSVSDRLIFLDSLATELGIDNLKVRRALTTDTDFDDGSFDAIFCYSVLHLTPWRETLAEFMRLLKDDGVLYVNANGAGWYKHLWLTAHNAADDYDPRVTAANVWVNTLNYEKGALSRQAGDILIEPDDLVSNLEILGFVDIRLGGEGQLCVPGRKAICEPFFQAEYYGETGVYEILAKRPPGGAVNSRSRS